MYIYIYRYKSHQMLCCRLNVTGIAKTYCGQNGPIDKSREGKVKANSFAK